MNIKELETSKGPTPVVTGAVRYLAGHPMTDNESDWSDAQSVDYDYTPTSYQTATTSTCESRGSKTPPQKNLPKTKVNLVSLYRRLRNPNISRYIPNVSTLDFSRDFKARYGNGIYQDDNMEDSCDESVVVDDFNRSLTMFNHIIGNTNEIVSKESHDLSTPFPLAIYRDDFLCTKHNMDNECDVIKESKSSVSCEFKLNEIFDSMDLNDRSFFKHVTPDENVASQNHVEDFCNEQKPMIEEPNVNEIHDVFDFDNVPLNDVLTDEHIQLDASHFSLDSDTNQMIQMNCSIFDLADLPHILPYDNEMILNGEETHLVNIQQRSTDEDVESLNDSTKTNDASYQIDEFDSNFNPGDYVDVDLFQLGEMKNSEIHDIADWITSSVNSLSTSCESRLDYNNPLDYDIPLKQRDETPPNQLKGVNRNFVKCGYSLPSPKVTLLSDNWEQQNRESVIKQCHTILRYDQYINDKCKALKNIQKLHYSLPGCNKCCQCLKEEEGIVSKIESNALVNIETNNVEYGYILERIKNIEKRLSKFDTSNTSCLNPSGILNFDNQQQEVTPDELKRGYEVASQLKRILHVESFDSLPSAIAAIMTRK